MAITSNNAVKNYTLAKGRVFIERFPTGIIMTATTRGSGEEYLGNSPVLNVSFAGETLDHFNSDEGINEKDDSVQTAANRSGTLSVDDITANNFAMAILGDSSALTVTSATGLESIFEGAQQGKEYQIGMDATYPSGRRKLANVVLKTGVAYADTVADLATNYELDADLGRIYIPAGSDIDNEDLKIEFDQTAHSREYTVSGADAIYCAIRLISKNPKGKDRDIYLPYVKMTPDGELALKGDTWQQLNFSLEILKKASNVPAMIVDGRPVA